MGLSDNSYRRAVENAPVGIYQVDDGELLYANRALIRMVGANAQNGADAEDVEIRFSDPADRERFRRSIEEDGFVEEFETELLTKTGAVVDVLLSGRLEDGTVTGYAIDITEQNALQHKTEQQAAAILELSTPIVQIWDGVLLATVIGTLDTERAQQLTEDLLVEITESQSEIALIDITGVPSVDTATAQHLIDTVNAVALLGSEVIITGINPNIAQTLVHLGITMSDIETRSSLSEGLEYALSLRDEDAPSQSHPGE